MATERLFSEEDINRLLVNNSSPPYGRRNAALIMGAVYWGLTSTELSLVTIQDVIKETGEFYRIWGLPKHVAYNGDEREVRTEDRVLPFFQGYVIWRKQEGWGTSNHAKWFGGLDPESKFFLNDRGEPYKLSPRKKGTGEYQPRSMNEQLNRLIVKAGLHGATPSSFRDSFIKEMYENGCSWNELKLVTGIKQKRTLDRKIRPQEKELDCVFNSLFAHVKYPF